MKVEKLHLMADNLGVIKWYVDSSFAVHPDFKSHTGGVMTYGRGVPITVSRKQCLNTRSSTEAELVRVNDMTMMILWTRLFLEAQRYRIYKNMLDYSTSHFRNWFNINTRWSNIEGNDYRPSSVVSSYNIRGFFNFGSARF